MAYYGLGTEEEILSALETSISQVSGIKFVDYQRAYYSGAGIDKYPGVFINAVATDKERLLKDLVRNEFGIQLVLWVWASEGESLITKQNEFINSVKDKIMEDPTQNSKAYDTVIESVATDAGSRHPQAVCVINLKVIFFSQE